MSTKTMNRHYSLPYRQSGAALIVSLIFLLIMTILALSMSQTTTLEERMAGNARDSNAAFQGAEAALSDGVNFLSLNNPSIAPNYLQTTDFTALNDSWWSTNGTEYGNAGAQELVKLKSSLSDADPQYVVRLRAIQSDSLSNQSNGPNRSKIYYYEVIGRSHGTTPDSEVVTSVVYAKRVQSQ